jgi:hypothetical protein
MNIYQHKIPYVLTVILACFIFCSCSVTLPQGYTSEAEYSRQAAKKVRKIIDYLKYNDVELASNEYHHRYDTEKQYYNLCYIKTVKSGGDSYQLRYCDGFHPEIIRTLSGYKLVPYNFEVDWDDSLTIFKNKRSKDDYDWKIMDSHLDGVLINPVSGSDDSYNGTYRPADDFEDAINLISRIIDKEYADGTAKKLTSERKAEWDDMARHFLKKFEK